MATAPSYEHLAEPLTVHVSSSPEYVVSIVRRSLNFDSLPAHVQPEFFFASLTSGWLPHVAVVRRQAKIVALVYAKERLLAGFATGILHVDVSLGMPALSPEVAAAAVEAAAKTFLGLPGVRGLRWLIGQEQENEYTNFGTIANDYDAEAACFPARRHRILLLPRTYEDFLDGLDPLMRQVFLQDRATAQAADENFVAAMPGAAFNRAVLDMTERKTRGVTLERVRAQADMLALLDEPMLAGTRSQDCRWLDVLAGWTAGDRAYLLPQMGETQTSAFPGFIVERLIQQGVKEVILWEGGAGALRIISQPMGVIDLRMDKRLLVWRATRLLTRMLSRLRPALRICTPSASMRAW